MAISIDKSKRMLKAPNIQSSGKPTAQRQISHEQAQKHYQAYYGGIVVEGDYMTSGAKSWG